MTWEARPGAMSRTEPLAPRQITAVWRNRALDLEDRVCELERELNGALILAEAGVRQHDLLPLFASVDHLIQYYSFVLPDVRVLEQRLARAKKAVGCA